MITGLEYHSYKENLRELELEKRSLKRRLRKVVSRCANSWEKSEKKIKSLSSVVSSEWTKFQMNINSNSRHFIYSFKFIWIQFLQINIHLRKYLKRKKRKVANGCLKRLWSLQVWNHSNPNWPQETCFNWPCFGQRFGKNHLLWFVGRGSFTLPFIGAKDIQILTASNISSFHPGKTRNNTQMCLRNSSGKVYHTLDHLEQAYSPY